MAKVDPMTIPEAPKPDHDLPTPDRPEPPKPDHDLPGRGPGDRPDQDLPGRPDRPEPKVPERS